MLVLTGHAHTTNGPRSDAAIIRPLLRLQPVTRAKLTAKERFAIAKHEYAVGPTCHVSNGDEENVPLYAGNYHKSLPHDKFGQVCMFYVGSRVCLSFIRFTSNFMSFVFLSPSYVLVSSNYSTVLAVETWIRGTTVLALQICRRKYSSFFSRRRLEYSRPSSTQGE